MTTEAPPQPAQPVEKQLERVTIRFAGDSGDGMQLTGTQFTRTADPGARGQPSRRVRVPAELLEH